MNDKIEIDEQPGKEECSSCAGFELSEDLIHCGICHEGPFCVSCCYDHDNTHDYRKGVKPDANDRGESKEAS